MKNPPFQPEGSPQIYRRAASAARLGLLVQAGLTIAMTLLTLYAGSPALTGAALHLGGGLAVWAILLILFHQHRLERIEAMEAERFAAAEPASAALFDQRADELNLARSRLQHLYRWGLGAASLAVAIHLIVAGGLLLRSAARAWSQTTLVSAALRDGADTAAVMAALIAIAFVGFVMARYQSGMTQVPQCRLLRGGATYLMGNVVSVLLCFVGTVAAHYGEPAPLAYLGGFVIPACLLVLGLETLLIQLLSFYRPRRPGQVDRPAFDSRLLGWLTSPQSIAQAISDALNYQFGFEVSRSWFYQLLSQWIVPLIAVGLAALIGLSTLVIVAPHEQAIVTRFGAIVGQPLGPGLHVKPPWPIGRAWKYPAGRVQQVHVGSDPVEQDPRQPLLWTGSNVPKGDYLIVAPTPLTTQAPTDPDDHFGSPAGLGLSLVGARVVVQYRVADTAKYLSAAEDPGRLLAALADRATNACFLTKDIDTLLGSGRAQAAAELQTALQAEVDRLGLGLQILFVGLTAIHPPDEEGVAAAFLEQIDAQQERAALVEGARQEAIETLASVAGSREEALQIDRQIIELQQLTEAVNQASDHPTTQSLRQQIAQKEAQIERLLIASRGQAAQIVYEALADRWQRVMAERGKAERFRFELAAYRSAPRYYRARQYLKALADGLSGARKYVVAVDRGLPPTFRLDLKDPASAIDTVFTQPQ
jgi:regulator of protease activity HflC (stomatin/prohibitin superfamily)